ncbi:MAG: HU family DNA-binding protein [Thermodesulfobacteriota bacterium]|nr:HU family DNA-binding protein [Thermodesulfobacteriota bacterium]
MTKVELVTKIANDAKISKAAAEKALNSFTKNVTDTLKKGEKITLTGFGTFSVVARKARKGRNPQTGNDITIPATKVVKFKTGKNLKEAVK